MAVSGLTRLSDIRGQERAVALLRRALAAGKVPHAYLFDGPAGVSKATTAVALYLALACPEGGCGACPVCEKVAAETHPDLIVLAPEGAGRVISVTAVRELCARMSFPPHEAAARLVILEDSDRLTAEAANAFLKTLEEPPPRTHFVLCTTAPDALLITIRSRCQRIRFLPLSSETAAEILVQSGAALDDELLERRRERALQLLRAARGRDFQSVVDAAQATSQEKDDVAPTLELLAHYYRDAAALAAGMGPESIHHRDRADDLRAEAEAGGGPAALARRAAAVLETQANVRAHAHPQLALERMVLALRNE